MADYGVGGEGAPVGGGPVNWGDNVAGMNQTSVEQQAGSDGQPVATPPEQGEQQPSQSQQQPEQPSGYQPTAPEFWEPGKPLPWHDSPDAPALPDLPQYPPTDPQQLLPAVVAAREQAIVGHFTALMERVEDDAQRREVDREYRITLREYRTAIREQRAELADWQAQHRERQMMVNLVPALRDQHADALARKYNLSKEQILKDHFTGAPIWNHQAMERQAQFLGQMGVQQRVQERGGRDAGPTTTGAAGPAPGDVSRMSSEQFRQYREQVKKSGGRLLHRLG